MTSRRNLFNASMIDLPSARRRRAKWNTLYEAVAAVDDRGYKLQFFDVATLLFTDG